jgi:hypothetical protein
MYEQPRDLLEAVASSDADQPGAQAVDIAIGLVLGYALITSAAEQTF